MSRKLVMILVAVAPVLLCSCGIVADAVHQSHLNSEYERDKNIYTNRFLDDGKTIEYTKLGFGISHSPTNLVKTERKWERGFRERWWQPNTYYESAAWRHQEEPELALLIFAPDLIPKWADAKQYCGYCLTSLNKYLKESQSITHWNGRDYVIGGRGFEIKAAEDRGEYDLPRNDKSWRVCRRKLTLANDQQFDFTLCYLTRDNRLYAFELVTPEPRRNDDFELMLAWMDSLYFLTNSPPPVVHQ